jgi:hypothetical protein
MREAAQKAGDADRMQLWTGQSARVAQDQSADIFWSADMGRYPLTSEARRQQLVLPAIKPWRDPFQAISSWREGYRSKGSSPVVRALLPQSHPIRTGMTRTPSVSVLIFCHREMSAERKGFQQARIHMKWIVRPLRYNSVDSNQLL